MCHIFQYNWCKLCLFNPAANFLSQTLQLKLKQASKFLPRFSKRTEKLRPEIPPFTILRMNISLESGSILSNQFVIYFNKMFSKF